MLTSRQSFPVRRASLLALALIFVASSLLIFEARVAQADGAVVATGSRCTVFDGNGNLVNVAGRSHRVLVPSLASNTKYTCTSRGVARPPGRKAVQWNYENTGIECSTLFGLTKDWRQIVTPSGQVTLSCFINPNPTP